MSHKGFPKATQGLKRAVAGGHRSEPRWRSCWLWLWSSPCCCCWGTPLTSPPERSRTFWCSLSRTRRQRRRRQRLLRPTLASCSRRRCRSRDSRAPPATAVLGSPPATRPASAGAEPSASAAAGPAPPTRPASARASGRRGRPFRIQRATPPASTTTRGLWNSSRCLQSSSADGLSSGTCSSASLRPDVTTSSAPEKYLEHRRQSVRLYCSSYFYCIL